MAQKGKKVGENKQLNKRIVAYSIYLLVKHKIQFNRTWNPLVMRQRK